MPHPDAIIHALHDTLRKDPPSGDLLGKSITRANESARAELDPTLSAALPWPTDLGEYDEPTIRHASQLDR